MKGLRMDRRPTQWIAMALAYTFTVLVCNAVTVAQQAGFEEQLRELQQALDDAQRANQAVRLELDEADPRTKPAR